MKNSLKERLYKGETLFGAFSTIHSATLIELLGLLGLDFVILDGEHSGLTPERAEDLYRAAELRQLACVTRIGEQHPQVIQKYLESGALNLLFPMVNTKADAQRLIEAVKYPPVGKRGLAAARVSHWGFGSGGLTEHVRLSNQETLIALQIETLEGIENLSEILSVQEADVIFFGPSDLSSALGIPGETQHPRVVSLIEDLGAKARAAGKIVGTIARTPEAYRHWKSKGFQWLCTGVQNLIADGVQSFLRAIR
ncbi:MAG: aldolase/citrate lyase family protein [Candidatus Bipolaricaulota bacterium]|nr:aldolase/citrate lyase family protein [Candidatus Bipolaricaulota bacterium]